WSDLHGVRVQDEPHSVGIPCCSWYGGFRRFVHVPQDDHEHLRHSDRLYAERQRLQIRKACHAVLGLVRQYKCNPMRSSCSSRCCSEPSSCVGPPYLWRPSSLASFLPWYLLGTSR